MAARKVVICGAAGRDYHNFNIVYRDDPDVRVVAFTATQIPGISGRQYPPSLAGPAYPQGIAIVDEQSLEQLVRTESVDEVVFAYSDVSHADVMHLASRVLASGARFTVCGPNESMVRSTRPVIAISAVRTGCGKSQIARYLSSQLRQKDINVVAIRHPMPYGVLRRQAVQRFAAMADLEAADCTLEEREEYEPHVAAGNVIFAGVDYQAITKQADEEADLIVWDGGNNDFPFLRPDFHIVVVDALRPHHLNTHHPGEAVLRMADVVILNKVDAATSEQLNRARIGLGAIVPQVPIIEAASPVTLQSPIERGARVLIVEDGPTITHGGMPWGSGFAAVRELDIEIVDPRLSATPAIKAVYDRYPHIGPVLPAMGYSAEQRHELATTINNSAAEFVVAGTPIDLATDVPINKPVVRVRYDYDDGPQRQLMRVINEFVEARISTG